MKISIFGLGYVGCVSLGCLARNMHTVIGVDINLNKVDAVNHGNCPIIEKKIDGIIKEEYEKGKISATTDSVAAIKETVLSMICVGTPSARNGHLDLSAIYKVAEDIGKGIKKKSDFHVVAIRSTVFPGTNEQVTVIIENASNKKRDIDFAVVSNPEFLREGSAVSDYFNPPYTIIGSKNEKAIKMVRSIYSNLSSPVIETDIKIAELIKYANNAYHALKICFANEIGSICDQIEIDSHELMKIFCMDNKLNISSYYLKPGFAYGGSCLPKDLKALNTIAHDCYVETPLLESIDKSNEQQKLCVLNQLIQFNKNKVGFLGISFKPGTDDLRNSPIIDIIERLIGKGFDIKIYDKNVHMSKLIGANRDYVLKKIPYISNLVSNNPINVIKHSEVMVIVHPIEEIDGLIEHIDENTIIYDLVNTGNSTIKKYRNYCGLSW